MRSTLLTVAWVTAVACGGRAGMGDESDFEAEGGTFNGGASVSGAVKGGFTNGGATNAGATTSGGRFSSGGAILQLGGAPTTSGGSVATRGGSFGTSGGRSPNGGAPSLGGSIGTAGWFAGGWGGVGGEGGESGCFTALQSGDNYCAFVWLCSDAQYEHLCTYDPGTADTTCTCFADGHAISGRTFQPPSRIDLCAFVMHNSCP